MLIFQARFPRANFSSRRFNEFLMKPGRLAEAATRAAGGGRGISRVWKHNVMLVLDHTACRDRSPRVRARPRLMDGAPGRGPLCAEAKFRNAARRRVWPNHTTIIK
ncbi:hypothetical protein EVAR_69604_1 [Eumeta japonica]|uniref:Uncharacterized protein n=1 Tax=Eumeta variegata TaxID=151549 RepID=A0A4C2A381_EUMVA|nr:hypothetical protein EVAR_69604_1 [Eumeta japonica]